MHVELAGDHPTGSSKPGHRRAVLGRDEVGENFRSGCRSDPASPVVVFEPDGDAMQRTAISACSDLALGLTRVGHCPVEGGGNVGMQLWLDSVRAVDHCMQHVDRR